MTEKKRDATLHSLLFTSRCHNFHSVRLFFFAILFISPITVVKVLQCMVHHYTAYTPYKLTSPSFLGSRCYCPVSVIAGAHADSIPALPCSDQRQLLTTIRQGTPVDATNPVSRTVWVLSCENVWCQGK